MSWMGMLEALGRDFRIGARALRRAPGFTAVAVATLALGIGANVTLFTVADSVLRRPLPYQDPDRLVRMLGRINRYVGASTSPPDFLDFRREAASFETFAASTSMTNVVNVSAGAEPLQARSVLVTAGFFETFGVAPQAGRFVVADDEQESEPRVAVLSHGFWQRALGGDPAAVGRALQVDGKPLTIAGIMPAAFDYPRQAELWLPAPLKASGMQVRRFHFLRPVARLAPGVDLAQAQAELDVIARRLEARYPDSNTGWGLAIEPLHEALVGRARPALVLLLAAVGLVLAIACANLASLMLARAASRHKELAVRKALGASRSRLATQLLAESLLLAAGGGLVGLLLALWGVDVVRTLGPSDLPRLEQISVDATGLVFTFAVSLLSGLAFGAAPALQATGRSLFASLKEGGRASGGPGPLAARRSLVVAEVAISVTLLASAGLLMRSFNKLVSVDPGFRAEGLLTTSLKLPETRYDTGEKITLLTQRLIEKTEALPGVDSAAVVSELPFSDQRNDTFFTIDGRPPLPAGQKLNAHHRCVSAGYFETMGIRSVRGRSFTHQDRAGAPGVVVISEPMARLYFPGEDPIGQRLVVDLGDPFPAEIVGVVDGIRNDSLDSDPLPMMYLPAAQSPRLRMNLVVRAEGDAAAIASPLRGVLQEIDAEQALGDVMTMSRRLDLSVSSERFRSLTLGLFAALAVALACVGLYGLISYSVSQRSHEIGVRMALGARAVDVMRLIVGQGLRLAAAGAVIGLAATLAASRLLADLLFGVSAADPLTLALSVALLLVVALAACWLPARRAARLDPLTALRYE